MRETGKEECKMARVYGRLYHSCTAREKSLAQILCMHKKTEAERKQAMKRGASRRLIDEQKTYRVVKAVDKI